MRTRITTHETPHYIERRLRFYAGAMTGSTVSIGNDYRIGDLPADHVKRWRDDVNRAKATGREMYAVWSYDTPIGWAVGGETPYMPPVRYSITTSRHQDLVMRGFNAQAFTFTWPRAVPVGTYGSREGW